MKKILNKFRHVTLTTNQLLLFTCAYIALILNLPFLIKSSNAITELDNYNLLFLLSLPVFLLCLTLILQGLFSFKWVTKPVLILMVIISAIMFYATITYGIVFDYGMIQNTVETDAAEAISYINIYAIVFFALFALVPACIIYAVKLTYQPFIYELLSRLKLLSISFGIAVIIASVFYSNYAAVGRNNKALISYIAPYKMLDSSLKFVRNHYFYPPLAFKVLDSKPTIAKVSDTKSVTVIVLGETARSQSFSLNGYNKPTNQYTDKLGVISFSNLTSCGTATAVSVPCMFSRIDKNHYNKRRATAQQNVIDIVHLAGADVLWISNNNGSCKGVCTRVQTEQIPTDKSDPLCDGEYCFDEALLKPLKLKLKNLTHQSTLIVLHMIGSHGPTYYRRYPQEKRLFSPDCQRSDIQNCTQEQLINTYDNTIAYTDFVLSRIINEIDTLAKTENIETSMLYVSDHGESLGEKGAYLHGLPYAFAPEQQTHIPMIYWANNQQQDFNLSCLENMSSVAISHDNIFDTILSIMSVRSKVYDSNNDPLIHCKSQSAIARTMVINTPNMEIIQ